MSPSIGFPMYPADGVAWGQQFQLHCGAWWSRITQVFFVKGGFFSKCSRGAMRKNSIWELGYVQLYAVPTVALVGICCLDVTGRNLCFCASPVTCRFEAVANEA